MGSFNYIGYEGRKVIESMVQAGLPISAISNALQKEEHLIREELKRGGEPYSAEVAQQRLGSPASDAPIERKRKNNHRISYEDRLKIAQMLKEGRSDLYIARALDLHRITVYRELKRGGSPYDPDVAQRTLLR